MSNTSVLGSPSTSPSARVIAGVSLTMIGLALLAWEYQSSIRNSPPLMWLFPGVPFLILAGLTLFKQTPLGVPIGAGVGGLVPVAVMYRAIFLSKLNDSGGGADIGLGLLCLGMLILLPFCMLIGGGIGRLIESVSNRRPSNAAHRVPH